MAPKLNIIIVGGGIAGLSTAISLRRSGNTVTVLERHSCPQALGGPIGLTPNATRVLIEYGLREVMEKAHVAVEGEINFRRWANGEVLDSMRRDELTEVYGFPSWSCSRFKVQEILAEVAVQRGVKIIFSAQVFGVDLEKPAVFLKHGTSMEADLVVGADGIRSVIRGAVAGNTEFKTSSPYGSYNIDFPRSLLQSDPEVDYLTRGDNFWFGPQIVVAINMPDHGDNLNVAFGTVSDDGQEGEWHTHGDLEKLKETFADYDPGIVKLLTYAKAEDCYIWRQSDLPHTDHWVSKSGRVVMIGDAVHAMLPAVGMGASQGIEDSACLAMCLEAAQSIHDLPKVLHAFETIRKPRAEWMVQRGREESLGFFLPDGEAQQQRDAYIKNNRLWLPTGWDGSHVDEPPEGQFNPLSHAYRQAFNIFDYTERRLADLLK